MKLRIDWYKKLIFDQKSTYNSCKLSRRCDKAFRRKKDSELHQTTHTSEKHFTCDTCGKQFPRYISLQRHSLIHSGVQPYECSVCGMKFNQSSSMQRHMLIHTGEKPYSCSDCGERFRQSSCLASHRRRHCAKNKQKWYCTAVRNFTVTEWYMIHLHARYLRQLTSIM